MQGMPVPVLEPTEEHLRQAAQRLREGGLVAMPTETVYGLAADATNDRAVAAIFAAKGRPAFNPLIVHVNTQDEAAALVEMNDLARDMAARFWPGPLTMVLPRRDGSPLSLLTAAGLPTQAIRIPAHPVARGLIAALGRPVAAPSANLSGQISPTTAQHVVAGLGARAGLVLAGGKCDVGLESTVMDMTGDVPVILRHGAVTADDVRMHAGDVAFATEAGADGTVKSPGQLLRHYAPRTPLRLQAVDIAPDEALLAFGSVRFMGVRGGGHVRDLPEGRVMNLSETGDLYQAAANLFAMLHALDAGGFARIAVMDVPETGLGLAINDRLRRAAGG